MQPRILYLQFENVFVARWTSQCLSRPTKIWTAGVYCQNHHFVSDGQVRRSVADSTIALQSVVVTSHCVLVGANHTECCEFQRGRGDDHVHAPTSFQILRMFKESPTQSTVCATLMQSWSPPLLFVRGRQKRRKELAYFRIL